MITNEQKVQVAKDRAISELDNLAKEGYWKCNQEKKDRIKLLGFFLSHNDKDDYTLSLALALNYINGEEEMYFE